MTLFAATPGNAVGQLAAAVLLGAMAFYWLLPRPRGRSVAFGTFAAIAAAVVLTLWVVRQFGAPAVGTVEQILFWLFSGGTVLFATLFVTQRNPARGAIAFAFVILNVCGLFLLLAAPFLMAATIVIYAGAIIVTFLFVLMLSNTDHPSDENDRSREPLLGSLAGFAFAGLMLFTLYASSPGATADAGKPENALPARTLGHTDRAELLAIAATLAELSSTDDRIKLMEQSIGLKDRLTAVIGSDGSGLMARLTVRKDPLAVAVKNQAVELRNKSTQAFGVFDEMLAKPAATAAEVTAGKAPLLALREQVVLLAGRGELPARNVANIGYALFTDHLLAVEMAGTALLVATIGAVAIAGKKGASA